MSKNKFVIIVSITAGACLLAIAGLVIYNLPPAKINSPQPAKISWEIPAPEGVVSGPDNIIFCSGIITDIKDGVIAIEAPKSRNIFFKADRSLMIKTEPGTQISTAVEYADASSGAKARRSLSLSDLKKGDSLIIQSKNPISTTDDVTAVNIYVVE